MFLLLKISKDDNGCVLNNNIKNNNPEFSLPMEVPRNHIPKLNLNWTVWLLWRHMGWKMDYYLKTSLHDIFQIPIDNIVYDFDNCKVSIIYYPYLYEITGTSITVYQIDHTFKMPVQVGRSMWDLAKIDLRPLPVPDYILNRVT